MEAGFGEEHEMFRRSLRAFVEREIAPRVLEWEAASEVPRALFRRLGALGWLGLRLSPEHGGGGCDFRYTAVLVQELMRCGSIGVPVSILAHAEFATKVIDRGGSEELKAEFVRPAAAGERIGALGVTEPDAGSDVGALRTRAVRDGGDWVINGAKTFISNGSIADFVTTAVRTGGPGNAGLSLIVVPADAPGFARGRRLKKLGTHASDTAELSFQDCRVPARNLVGAEGGGFKLIMQGFEGERLVLALIACAQMRLMWEEARRYGRERQAFGRPLLGFQVWQHRLADALASVEAADALTERAIDLYVRSEPCNGPISMAKLFATETALDLARTCAQIFGGMGYMEECRMARLYRDSLALTIGAGTSEMMREIIARTSGLAGGEGNP
ncbi:MAG: acyl-CoA dehydrogenase family protein [Burkholderiales bacterium]|nr:acyl-CoA dehydrogenase family protein [Burkholderiales bacterium]